MGKKIKNKLMQYPSIYSLARCLKNISDPNLYKLLVGYYENNPQSLSLLLNNPEKLIIGTPIYDIQIDVEEATKMGFCALIFHTIRSLEFAEQICWLPRVTWGKKCLYFDTGMNNKTENVFEYYFEPIGEKNNDDVASVDAKYNHRFIGTTDSYYTFNNDVGCAGIIYKKFIHLNLATKEYLEDKMLKCFKDQRILGIHARGTDFGQNLNDHPIKVKKTEYLNTAKELFAGSKYDKIFIATDDLTILDLFINEFGDDLLFYEDTVRGKNNTGVHMENNDRALHHYKLGLEVLRDVYSLACCRSLICGLSHVSFAARYINIAIGKKFDDIRIINKGINAMK